MDVHNFWHVLVVVGITLIVAGLVCSSSKRIIAFYNPPNKPRTAALRYAHLYFSVGVMGLVPAIVYLCNAGPGVVGAILGSWFIAFFACVIVAGIGTFLIHIDDSPDQS